MNKYVIGATFKSDSCSLSLFVVFAECPATATEILTAYYDEHGNPANIVCVYTADSWNDISTEVETKLEDATLGADFYPGKDHARCDNCEKTWHDAAVIPLDKCHKLIERLEPGDTVPMGECPSCGCFCYEIGTS